MLHILFNALTRLSGLALIIFSVYYGISHDAAAVIANCLHLPSFVFVGLGLVGILLASYQAELISVMGWNIFALSPVLLHNRVRRVENSLMPLAELYYQQGPTALIDEVKKRRLPPIWKYIAQQMEARLPIHDIQGLIQHEGKRYNEHLFTQIRMLQGLATIAPAVGMTGTILGLLKLLSELSQFDKLGSNMALAFITALYGLLFGNFLFIPLANRMNEAREETMELFSQALSWLEMVTHRKPAGYLNRSEHRGMVK